VLLDQRLLLVRQLGILERDDHSLARLAFLVAVRITYWTSLLPLMVLVRKNTHPNSKTQKKNQAQIQRLGTTTDPKNSDVDNQRLTIEKTPDFSKKRPEKGCFIRNLGEGWKGCG